MIFFIIAAVFWLIILVLWLFEKFGNEIIAFTFNVGVLSALFFIIYIIYG